MSIIIGRIENKFWSNSGHKFPNGFPIYAEQKELKDDSPNIINRIAGTIYLEGDSWNHCKYKGAFYSLYILHEVSHRKERYVYRLERDLWMDILMRRPKVIGDLANSNNDELLEANLNRTVGVLENPARIITINFGNVDFDWKKNFIFKESKKDLVQVVLSRDEFNHFIALTKGGFIKAWKDINSHFYAFSSYDGIPKRNDATFIFSYLQRSFTKEGWKHILREKINEFVKSIDSDASVNLKISKVNAQAFVNSAINGNYCITHKTEGISTTEENIRLKEIDLSGLEDIIPINIHNLLEIEPYTPLYEGNKSGLFDVFESKLRISPFLAKIRRKAYLPINAADESLVPKTLKDHWPFIHSSYNWNRVKSPQVVNWNYAGREGTFNLWFLDNVNFITTVQGEDYFRVRLPSPWAYLTGPGVFVWFGVIWDWQDMLKAFNKNSFVPFPNPIPYYQLPFKHLKEETVVPFGLLIYGLQRRYEEWRKYEYIGNEEKTSLIYWSGIRKKLLEKYSESGQWWSEIDPLLANIQPTEEFTKFYLDNYYFTWTCFFSNNNSSYFDFGAAGLDQVNFSYSGTIPAFTNKQFWDAIIKHTNSIYIDSLINKDIHDNKGKWKKQNPFSDKRFPAYRQWIDNNLFNLFNHGEIELPKDVSISKGDYFFSDQDYEILQYPDNFLNRFEEMKKVSNTWSNQSTPVWALFNPIPHAFLIEDMMNIRGGKLFANETGEKMVVLCTTKNGGFDIRTLETFERVLKLNSASDEIVEAVDGSKMRLTRFTLLKKMSDDLLDENFKELTDEHKEKIIHAFYKLNGYKTKLVGKVAHWTWFNKEDFEPNSNVQQLFDLVGTDWYAFIAKGKISLISKNKKLFEKQKGQTSKLLHEENKDLNLSLVEKINQKVRFQFFSAPYYLRWKSSFSDKDKINLALETLQPTNLQTDFDQYFLKLDTEFDNIHFENLSIPKKQTKALSPADNAQLERLRLDFAAAQYSYQIDLDRHKLATDRFNESIKRAEIDLQHQRIRSWLQLGSGAAASSFGTGMSLRYRKGRQFVTTLKKSTKEIDDPNNPDPMFFVGPKGAAQTEFRRARIEVPIETKQVKYIPGKVPNIAAGLVTAGLMKAAGAIMDHAFTFPEQERRIGVDKQLGASDLALQSLAIDTGFMEAQINHQVAINNITNTHSNPMINDREIMEDYMDQEEWHGKKLKPAHLVCFVPSEEQLVALREFKKEYGVMCDIPNVETNFYEGMKEDVIRYRNLDDDAIKGLPDEWMKTFLHGHLLAGIKIVKTTSETYELLDVDDYRDKIFRLNTDLLEKANEIDNKEKQILVLQGKIDTAKDEAKKECAQEASELQKRITQTENQVNEINRQLREKIAELEKWKNTASDYRKEFDKKVAELAKAKDDAQGYKENAEELTQKLNDERRKFLDERDQINKLNKKLEEDVKDLAAKTEELNQLKIDYQAKVRELDVCKLDKADAKPCPAPKDKKGTCQLVKELIGSPERPPQVIEASGWNPFLHLVFAIAKSRNIQRSNFTPLPFQTEELNTFKDEINTIFEFDFIQAASETLQMPGWAKYQEWLKNGGNKNGTVDAVIAKVNEIKNHETEVKRAGLKVLLDEAHYTFYLVTKNLHQEIGENEQLRNYFTQVFPGEILEKYEAAFGDPNRYVIQRRFVDEVKCDANNGNTNVYEILKRMKDNTKLKERVPKPVKIPVGTLDPADPIKPMAAPKYAGNVETMDEARYANILLKDIDNAMKRYMYDLAAPIFAFEDSYVSRNLENRDYVWNTRNGVEMKLSNFPKARGIEFWKWPYYKKAAGWSQNRKVIWFKWRDNDTSSDSSKINQYGNYLEAQDLRIEEFLARFEYLVNNLKLINIPEKLLSDFKDGTKTLVLRLSQFEWRSGYNNRGAHRMTNEISFGTGKEQILWPEEHLDKLLKLVFVLHVLYTDVNYHGTLDSDGFNVWSFDLGMYHPGDSNTSGMSNQRLLTEINEVIRRISVSESKRIDLKLGTLFESRFYERLRLNRGDLRTLRDRSGSIQDANDDTSWSFATLFAWIYSMWSNRYQKFYAHSLTHPYTWGYNTNRDIAGAMRLMFRRMAHVANSK